MKRYESVLYSAGGVIAVFLILLLLNFIFGAFKSTEENTASDETLEILDNTGEGGDDAP